MQPKFRSLDELDDIIAVRSSSLRPSDMDDMYTEVAVFIEAVEEEEAQRARVHAARKPLPKEKS